MTVAELIAELQKLPPDIPVMAEVQGGYWPCAGVEVLPMANNGGQKHYVADDDQSADVRAAVLMW
jgi:hypothetical protein